MNDFESCVVMVGSGSTPVVSKRSETITLSMNNPADWWAFNGEPATSGATVNHKTVMGYDPIWRGINLISRSVAKIPFIVYRRTDDDGRERFREHPAYPLLRRKAGAEHTANIFQETLQGHALSYGNGYAYIFRNGDASPKELIPLSPSATFPVRENGRLLYVTTLNNAMRKLLPENVLHIKGLGFDGLQGYDVITMARNSLGLGVAAQEYGSSFFRNDARPAVVIEHPKRLGEEAARTLRKSWNEMHQGLNNAHKVAILEEGMKINPFSINARDAQLNETREHEIRVAANWLGIPPHKLGDTSRTAYASLEQENQSFLDDCLDPWLITWEYECNDKLLTEQEKADESAYCEFMREAFVRANLATQGAFFRTALGGAAFMAKNEVRRKLNLPPVEGGDTILDPLNMTQGGADNLPDNPGDNPPPEPGVPADEATRAIYRKIIHDSAVRMVKRLTKQACKAAKFPGQFISLTEAIETEQRSYTLDCLLAPAMLYRTEPEAVKVVDDMFVKLKGDLIELSGTVTPDLLPASVDQWATTAEANWPDQITVTIMGEPGK